MGFPPDCVDRQELWPFMAAWDTYKQANGITEKASGGGDLSDADLERMGIVGFEAE